MHHLLLGDFGDFGGEGGLGNGPALHESLLGNWELLNRVAAANQEQNLRREGEGERGGGEETYLLSQVNGGVGEPMLGLLGGWEKLCLSCLSRPASLS